MKFRHPTNPRKPTAQTHRQVTGASSRPQAFSYHANRTDQEVAFGRQQPREQDNRKRARVFKQLSQRFGLVVVALVLLVCVIDVLKLSSEPKIVSLAATSSNDFLQPLSVYQQAATKLFSDSLFNANKVTVQTETIQDSLKRQYPELADVSITLPLISHRPIVYIAPTTPGLILSTASKAYILDENGKVLLPADKIADLDKLKLPTLQDQGNTAITTGKVALPSSSILFIKTVQAQLTAKGVTIDTLTLPAAAYELDVKPVGANYFIKFNMQATGEAKQQAGTYLAVRQRLAEQSITPALYIDVRVSGRAYYQ